jgi:hypothetical protein
LDDLVEALGSRAEWVEQFRAAYVAATNHYEREDEFFRSLLRQLPGPIDKMLAQHAEAIEIALHIEDLLTIGHVSDAMALTRRFRAIAQHNIIEEERDVFPLLAT